MSPEIREDFIFVKRGGSPRRVHFLDLISTNRTPSSVSFHHLFAIEIYSREPRRSRALGSKTARARDVWKSVSSRKIADGLFFLLLRGFFLCEVEFGREGFDPGGPTNFPDFPESVLSHHWELHFEPRTLHLPAMGAL
jgi:hypothetical protein